MKTSKYLLLLGLQMVRPHYFYQLVHLVAKLKLTSINNINRDNDLDILIPEVSESRFPARTSVSILLEMKQYSCHEMEMTGKSKLCIHMLKSKTS